MRSSKSSLVSTSASIVLGTMILSASAMGLHGRAAAEVCNIKVVTDGNPDYTDMASLIHSGTSSWPAVYLHDTFATYPCAAIDFYGNEISECAECQQFQREFRPTDSEES